MARGIGLSAVQVSVVNGDIERNLATIRGHISYIAKSYDWIDLIAFPEYALTGPAGRRLGEVAVTASESDPLLAPFCEDAVRFGKWIFTGAMYEREGENFYSSAFFISPEGRIAMHSRKMFPWYPYERIVPAPENYGICEIPGKGKIGVIICYDIWYPENARRLAELGAEAIFHPCATTTPDRKQELILGPAVAVANQLYYVDINCAGEDGIGHSQGIDPEGDVIIDAGQSEMVMNHFLDFERVARVRRNGTAGTNRILRQLLTTHLAPAGEGAFNGLEPLDVPRAGD